MRSESRLQSEYLPSVEKAGPSRVGTSMRQSGWWREMNHPVSEARPGAISACSSAATLKWLGRHRALYPSKASRSDCCTFDTFNLGSRRHLSHSMLSANPVKIRLVETPAVIRGQLFAETSIRFREEDAERAEARNRRIQEIQRETQMQIAQMRKSQMHGLMLRSGQRIVVGRSGCLSSMGDYAPPMNDAVRRQESQESIDDTIASYEEMFSTSSLFQDAFEKPLPWKTFIPTRCRRCGQNKATPNYCAACCTNKAWHGA